MIKLPTPGTFWKQACHKGRLYEVAMVIHWMGETIVAFRGLKARDELQSVPMDEWAQMMNLHLV